MADNKTKPTDASVAAFLEAATPDQRRHDGTELAEIFRDVTGTEPVMWGPSIVEYGTYRYQSPAKNGASGDWPKTGFSPRKTALTLYGLKDLPAGAALAPRLGGYTEGAGCIYIKKLDDVDRDVLRKLIAIAWARPNN